MIQLRPEICGIIAALPPICVWLTICPVNCEPMIEVATNFWPTCIRPRAAITAIRADTAVPVGERSIFPGLITTAERLAKPDLVSSKGPAKAQKEICLQSGLSGWVNPSCSVAAAVIFTPHLASSAASFSVRSKPSVSAQQIQSYRPQTRYQL